MKKFLKTRLGLYLTYFTIYGLFYMFFGFEFTVIVCLTSIIADLYFIDK